MGKEYTMHSRGDVGEASTASGHVPHMAIFSMQLKIWIWETYLDITCDEFVHMSIQGLHFLKGALIL